MDAIDKTTKVKKRKWWHINKLLFRFKLHFFLFCAGLGIVFTYVMNIVIDDIGLSGSSAGTITVCIYFACGFTKVLIGYIADFFNNIKFLMCILTFLHVTAFISLLLIPMIPLENVEIPSTLASNLNGTRDCIWKRNSESSNETTILSLNEDDGFYINDADFHICIQDDQCLMEHFTSKTGFSGKGFEIWRRSKNDSFLKSQVNEENNSNGFVHNISLFQREMCSEVVCLNNPKNISHDTSTFCLICCISRKIVEDSNKTRNVKFFVKGIQTDIDTYQFWVVLFLYSLIGICTNGMVMLSDTACCESVKNCNADFGEQRLGGLIGFSGGALLSGFFNDYTKSYTVMGCFYVAISALEVWNIKHMNLTKPKFSKYILKNIRSAVKTKEFLSFMLGVFITGVGFGNLVFSLCVFIHSLGGGKLICGLATAMSYTIQVPLLVKSEWFVKKIGQFNITTITIFACCIRFYWHSQIMNPWYILVFAWCTGVTGLMQVGMALFAKEKSKPGTEATAQAIVGGLYDSLGFGVGTVMTGIGFNYLGQHRTYFYFGTFFACCIPMNLFLTFINRKK